MPATQLNVGFQDLAGTVGQMLEHLDARMTQLLDSQTQLRGDVQSLQGDVQSLIEVRLRSVSAQILLHAAGRVQGPHLLPQPPPPHHLLQARGQHGPLGG